MPSSGTFTPGNVDQYLLFRLLDHILIPVKSVIGLMTTEKDQNQLLVQLLAAYHLLPDPQTEKTLVWLRLLEISADSCDSESLGECGQCTLRFPLKSTSSGQCSGCHITIYCSKGCQRR